MEKTLDARKKLFGLSLIMAPILQGISSFFWQGPEVGLAGGTILIYALVFWIPALFGLLWLIGPAMPRFSVWGTLLVSLGCIGGVNWANNGIYPAAYQAAGAGSLTNEALLSAMGASGPLTLHFPGPLFPIMLITIGIALFRTKVVPSWCAILLVLGGIAFPASRIPRIEMLAHVADLLLLIPAAWMGLRMLSAGEERNILHAAETRPGLV
jgi:hypothetical protein